MLSIHLIRKNPEIVRADLEKRNDQERAAFLEKVIQLDAAYLESLKKTEALRAKRNEISREVGKIKKAGGDAAALLAEAAKIPLQIETKEVEQQHSKDEIDYYLKRLPNILHESVPIGADDTSNVIIGEFGKKPSFSFQAKDHIEIMENLNFADTDRAGKIAGKRQYFLKGDLVLLDMAI